MQRAKSIFESRTFWFAIGTFWAAILPSLQSCTAANRPLNSVEWLGIVTALITTGGTIYGRYSAAADLYTPNGLPGRSKPEGEEETPIG